MAKRPTRESAPPPAPTEQTLEAVVRDALHHAGAGADPEAAARALIPVFATAMSRIPDATTRGAIMSWLHMSVGTATQHLPRVGREHTPKP